MYSFSQIAALLQAPVVGSGNGTIRYLSTDSRRIHFGAETLFFAILTPQRNGHTYLPDAYAQGVRQFVVTEGVDTLRLPGASFIQVKDTLQALQTLARQHRQQFHFPVVGITGSNGKTVVKEWLAQMLQTHFSVVRSPRSYNSQIGVPLSLWQMEAGNEVGLFEAGISQRGEMKALANMIRPTIGIFTTLGTAHNAGFDNQAQKLAEKLQLFASVETVIYNANDLQVKAAIDQLPVRQFSWGYAESCMLQIQEMVRWPQHTSFVCRYQGQVISFEAPFTDNASLENALHCFAACLLLGLPEPAIQEQLLQLQPLEMRLEWKRAINNCYLINDSYSNDLTSLLISLDYLQQQSGTHRQTVILSDIFQTGIHSGELYEQVANLLAEQRIERLIGIGPAIYKNRDVFATRLPQTQFFPATEALLQQLDTLSFRNEAILLKGARAFHFEKIARQLEEQSHQTVLEINLSAMAHNLKQYRSLLHPGTRMMMMVKSFGYGSGGAEVARLLQYNKVDYLAVAYADEAIPLRQAGVHTPVMVMNPDPAAFELMEAANLEPEIYSFDILEAFIKYCRSQGIGSYPIHLKLDTGMHRLGFEVMEAVRLGELLSGQTTLKVKSVFTHLVGSDDPQLDAETQQQAEAFAAACGTLEQHLGYSFMKHAANTAAIARHPHLQMDMVRLGIGLYGVDSARQLALDPVSTLQTSVAQVRKVRAGESVGYSRKGIITQDSLIATVRIGYADGFRRELSNGKGHMWVNGHSAPVVGNVCMDMTMLNVTNIPNVVVGSRVEVFGKNILIQDVAARCGTIPYEIMTGISQRVKRVYFEE